MILILDVSDFAPDGAPIAYHSADMQRAVADAVALAAKGLEDEGLMDVVITLRGLIVAVVRRGIEDQTEVTNFTPLCRM
jgi:hypothetical protein